MALSGIRGALQAAERLEAGGQSVIHFELGRPDFDTPAVIKQALRDAVDAGFVHYTPNAGIPELRAAIAEDLERQGLSYLPEDVLVTAGAQEALHCVFQAFVNPGDRVVIPSPAYPAYAAMAGMTEATPVFVPLREEEGWRLRTEDLAKSLKGARLLVVNFPHNPTGAIADEGLWAAVAEILAGTDTLVVSDEAYAQLVYEGHHLSPAHVEELRARTCVIGSFSKTFAMTGWRLGYVAAPRPWMDVLARVHQNVLLSATSFVQAAGVVAVREAAEPARAMREELRLRRDIVLQRLQPIKDLTIQVPRGTFYVFPRLPDGYDDRAFAAEILTQYGVSVVPGSVFGPGGENHFRLAACVSRADCAVGADRIRQALSGPRAASGSREDP